jgi:hypothetical protein
VFYCRLCPVRGPELFHADGRTYQSLFAILRKRIKKKGAFRIKVCSTSRKQLAKHLSKRKYFLTIAVEKQYILKSLDNLYALWI